MLIPFRRPGLGRWRGIHRPGEAARAARAARHALTADADPAVRRLVETTAPMDAAALAALLARPSARHAADLLTPDGAA